jgi:hypothetical protein
LPPTDIGVARYGEAGQISIVIAQSNGIAMEAVLSREQATELADGLRRELERGSSGP